MRLYAKNSIPWYLYLQPHVNRDNYAALQEGLQIQAGKKDSDISWKSHQWLPINYKG